MFSFYSSFSVVFPLLSLMSLGYFLTVIKVFDDVFLKKLNSLCFNVFMPFLLFTNIYRSDFAVSSAISMVGFGIASTVIVILLLLATMPRIIHDKPDCGVMIQAIFRSNFVLFGIQIADSLYGSENSSTTVVLVAFIIPIYNVMAVLVLAGFSNHKPSIVGMIKKMIKNPLIISSAISFIFVGFGLHVPDLLLSNMNQLAQIATPVALVALGGTFKFGNLKKYKYLLLSSTVFKLLIIPAIFVPISIWLGFRNMELTALMSMFATPTAVTTYTMAQNIGSNHELAGQIVVVSSLLSVVTIFFWVSFLQAYGYI